MTGSPPRALSGAVVQVRILSTLARASTVFQGRTAADGSCPISFMIPREPQRDGGRRHPRDRAQRQRRGQYPIKPK